MTQTPDPTPEDNKAPQVQRTAPDDRDRALLLTGERTIPGIAHENYWFRRHEVAYKYITQNYPHHIVNKDVLEAGPGEGYGAQALADLGGRVVGVDYDASAVEHIRTTYPDVSILQGNLVDLPLEAESVDTVVNFQVIEHLWDQPLFIREVYRVLCPGGVLLISTPNRITFSPGRDTPLNPFHTRELNPTELDDLIASGGLTTEHALGVFHGPRLTELDRTWGGSFIDAQIERSLRQDPWPKELTADVASITADDFVISDNHLDDSLDLLTIAIKA